MMERAGSATLITDGRCRVLQGGGTSVNYYSLTCSNNNLVGVFGCNSNTCTQCAVTNFAISASEIGTCINTKPYFCGTPGLASSCGVGDVAFNAAQCAGIVDDATTWAASVFAGGAAAIMANV